MKTAIVLGSTGLIGKEITNQLLNNTNYSKVIILVRSKQNTSHPKLEQIVFDFNNPNEAAIQSDDLFCCLGTTIKKAGTKEAFYKVDYDYVVNTAKIAKANGIKQFAVISSMGASETSGIFYNKTKGQMENAVKAISFTSTYIIRPSMLLGKREEFRLGEMIGKAFMTVLSFLIPKKYKAIYDLQVAKATIHFMNENASGFFVKENDDLLNVR